jgi:hypothetical protein
MDKNVVAAWIDYVWGERCSEYCPTCEGCRIWAAFDDDDNWPRAELETKACQPRSHLSAMPFDSECIHGHPIVGNHGQCPKCEDMLSSNRGVSQ